MKIAELIGKSIKEEVVGTSLMSSTNEVPNLPSANRAPDHHPTRDSLTQSDTRPTPIIGATILPCIRAMREYEIPDEELERIEHDKAAQPHREIRTAKYVEPGAPATYDAF